MQTEDFYAWFARYYDRLHAGLQEDLPFLLRLAQEAAGPVLELGCGSGRVLLPIARAGVAVTGVDNSPAMLALARERVAREPASVATRITLVEGDMTGFRLSSRYALALVAHNTFSHLTPDAMPASLRSVKAHLFPTGRLILDLPNPLQIAAADLDGQEAEEARFQDEETGEEVVQTARSCLADDGRRLEVTWRFEFTPADGGATTDRVATLAYTLVYPHELELMLRLAGMRLTALSGDYTGSPFSEESERLVVTATALP